MKTFIESKMNQFDEIAVYTNEYGYPHKIPNYDVIKDFITSLAVELVEEIRGKVPEEISKDIPTSLDIPEDVLSKMQNDMKHYRDGYMLCRSQVLAVLDDVISKEEKV